MDGKELSPNNFLFAAHMENVSICISGHPSNSQGQGQSVVYGDEWTSDKTDGRRSDNRSPISESHGDTQRADE